MKALYGKPGQAGRVRRDPQRPSSRQELRALPGSPALACALIRAWIAAWMVMVIRALMVPTDGADTRRGLPLNPLNYMTHITKSTGFTSPLSLGGHHSLVFGRTYLDP